MKPDGQNPGPTVAPHAQAGFGPELSHTLVPLTHSVAWWGRLCSLLGSGSGTKGI